MANPYGAVERALERTRQTLGGMFQHEAERERRKGLLGMKEAELGLTKLSLEEKMKERDFNRWLKTPGTIDSIFKQGVEQGYTKSEDAEVALQLFAESGVDTKNMVVTPESLADLKEQLRKETHAMALEAKKQKDRLALEKKEQEGRMALEKKKQEGRVAIEKMKLDATKGGKDLKVSDYKAGIQTVLGFYRKKDDMGAGLFLQVEKATDLQSLFATSESTYQYLNKLATEGDEDAMQHLEDLQFYYDKMAEKLGITRPEPEPTTEVAPPERLYEEVQSKGFKKTSEVVDYLMSKGMSKEQATIWVQQNN
jgi:hypothetical protein